MDLSAQPTLRFADCYMLDTDRELGRGGFGTVFMGVQMSTNAEIAVKRILKTRVNASPELANTIINEVNFLKKLNHKNIIQFLDFFEEKDCFYLCIELARGGDLLTRVSQRKKYTERDAQSICRTVLSALKHCHDHHIVHRDIKPENLMLRGTDTSSDILLVDFGLAIEDRDQCKLRGEVGTMSYMAAEIIKGDYYGKPVDLWAFGVVTFILLCGYQPFYARSAHNDVKAIRDQIQIAKFEFLPHYWDHLTPQSRDFVSKLLIVDQTQRMTVDEASQHPWVSWIMIV
jgi:calcium/calmodulin-dependent protein kinase I